MALSGMMSRAQFMGKRHQLCSLMLTLKELLSVPWVELIHFKSWQNAKNLCSLASVTVQPTANWKVTH